MTSTVTGLAVPTSQGEGTGLPGFLGKLGDTLIDVARWRFIDSERAEEEPRNIIDFTDVRTGQAAMNPRASTGSSGYADSNGFIRVSGTGDPPTRNQVVMWSVGLGLAVIVALLIGNALSK